MNARLSLFTILVCSISFFSCSTAYEEVEMLGMENLKVKKVSIKAIDVELGIRIRNPNKYSISIVDSDLNLMVDGKQMGNSTITNKITLPKKSEEVHTFQVKTSLSELGLMAVPTLLGIINKKKVALRVNGDIKARAMGIAKKVPVDFKENVSLNGLNLKK